jgi:hypothetical protein
MYSKERDHSEDRGVDESMDSELILGRLPGEWIKLSQDRVRWRALVNAVINLRVLAPRRLFVALLYDIDII